MKPDSSQLDLGIAGGRDTLKPVNVASVPQRSVFRYPGGKTWFVPEFRTWINSLGGRPRRLIEPFAGGGILSLTAAFEDLADDVIMCEIDEWVASVWRTILQGDSEALVHRILTFDLTQESAREVIMSSPNNDLDLAFQTILKNRTYHGGILAEGSGLLKNGESGKGIHSRWYPETLARRIRAIQQVRHKITFLQCDAFDILDEWKDDKATAWFIDPPYTAGGKRAGSRLYRHSVIDHEKLFRECEEIRGCFAMTYDDAEEVVALAEKSRFNVHRVSMKNTHHNNMFELVITNGCGSYQ